GDGAGAVATAEEREPAADPADARVERVDLAPLRGRLALGGVRRRLRLEQRFAGERGRRVGLAALRGELVHRRPRTREGVAGSGCLPPRRRHPLARRRELVVVMVKVQCREHIGDGDAYDRDSRHREQRRLPPPPDHPGGVALIAAWASRQRSCVARSVRLAPAPATDTWLSADDTPFRHRSSASICGPCNVTRSAVEASSCCTPWSCSWRVATWCWASSR